MRETKKVTITRDEFVALICDKCGRRSARSDSESVYELQEYSTITIHGGYGSIFGDGDSFECDLCQHCTKELLGKYLRNLDD